MFSPLRNRFGIPGVISVIALVFAMLGGAYAANSNGGGAKAGASAKGKPGPRGKTGKTGPAGPAGPQGPAGSNGKDGANGSNGKDGAAGKNGESVTVSSASAGECPVGGTKFSNGTGTGKACNGAEGEPGEPGEPGEDGSPWTADGTLPPGAIETGTWYASGEEGAVYAQISFPIPLAEIIRSAHVFAGLGGVLEPDGTEFKEHCAGEEFAPTAKNAGELCIYLSAVATPGTTFTQIARTPLGFPAGSTKAGGFLEFELPEPGEAMGTFAVKGCSTALSAGDPDKCPE